MDLSRLQQLLRSEEILICHHVVSQENPYRFFFIHFFYLVCPETGKEEVWRPARTVNQTAYYSQPFSSVNFILGFTDIYSLWRNN